MAKAEKQWPKVRHLKKRAFLQAFSRTGNPTLSAIAAQVNRTTHYLWLQEDPDYAEAFDDAREQAADWLEAEAVRRATEGVKRKIFTRSGDPIIDPETGLQYEEFTYSDNLLMFMLKGLRPQKFREGISVIQATGITVQQVAQDAAAMCRTIPPPAELFIEHARPPAIEHPIANGNGHQNNGHSNGNGHASEQ